MLQDLQPNIVKAHTRDRLTVLFLTFADSASGSALLAALAWMMKSAHTHLEEVRQFKTDQTPGTPYIGAGITKKGYVKLGVPEGQHPADPSFATGMHDAGLEDIHTLWEEHFLNEIHAVVLVGDAGVEGHDAALADVRAAIAAQPGVTVVAEQKGIGLHNTNGDGIEHFGYVDGRSQPLFLKEDIDDERLEGDGTSVWSPDFPLGQVIVPDAAAPDPATAHGSYFIFRKLEQDVKLFKESEQALAAALDLDDPELAGAMIVGRFEDGTPVTLQRDEGSHHPVLNDFDYDSDGDGGKCPFLGHIRKLNPRGSGGIGTPEFERSHIMARRGQTYGARPDNPNDGKTANKPTGGVGLLFMAFNANIGNQFEFTQKVWANNPNFPIVPGGVGAPGVDLVIGQTANDDPREDIELQTGWARRRGGTDAFKVVDAVPRAVTALGGEYFFMPSLSFLHSLAPTV